MKGASYQSVEPADVERYLADDAWVAEQKMDGVRLLVHVDEDGVRFLGANGNAVTFAAAAQHFDRLRALLVGCPVAVIDGELLIETGEFHAFDLPYCRNVVEPSDPLWQRRAALRTLAKHLGLGLVAQAQGRPAKAALWAAVVSGNQEGIVVKREDAPYPVGRRSSEILKVKVTKTIDCVVVARDTGGKNATLAVYRDGVLVEVGACSMIGKPDAQVGSVVEVVCLYATTGLRLYQPRLLRLRPDKSPEACEMAQVEAAVVNRAVVAA